MHLQPVRTMNVQDYTHSVTAPDFFGLEAQDIGGQDNIVIFLAK